MPHQLHYYLLGVPMEIDLCSVTQDDKKYYSFMTQNYGVLADCDLGTENMRQLIIHLHFCSYIYLYLYL